ncbi:hypothetical protein ASG42_26625 [Rhizobium sp. Leaf391]|nr:hypothetical protein ASG42_26625 [Rhizobium sp. Leaf391]
MSMLSLQTVYRALVIGASALEIGDFSPEKSIRHLNPDAFMAQFSVNPVGPALVLKHFTPKMAREGRSIIAFQSARVGSIGDNRLGGWISYRKAKAALDQIVRTAPIEIARSLSRDVVVAMYWQSRGRC